MDIDELIEIDADKFKPVPADLEKLRHALDKKVVQKCA